MWNEPKERETFPVIPIIGDELFRNFSFIERLIATLEKIQFETD